MESGSSFDRPSVGRNAETGTKLAGTANLGRANLGLNPEEGMQQESSTRTSQASVSAALAAANAALRDMPSMRLSRPESGRSLADMAQRDLDAALQLLTDRAQYITGSSGAAIALRRSGTNDMLCRASTGSNAPELGTLLSTEFGLSGESVRTRRALRCDDAQRDARVNHDVCREVGIASVVVMPVVHDDEVLGVFELFSGKAHAFGERDMSALQRLSEMVETAVRLAHAAQEIPDRWSSESRSSESKISAEPVAGASPEKSAAVSEAQDLWIDEPVEVETEAAPAARAAAVAASAKSPAIPQPPAAIPPPMRPEAPVSAVLTSPASTLSSTTTTPATAISATPAPATPMPAKKPLLWSADANVIGDARKPSDADQSHVPPVFRSLRKCEACGFPVSSERALCVECEEKKWRGQLKPKSTVAASTAGSAAAAAAPALEIAKDTARKDIAKDLHLTSAISDATVKATPLAQPKPEPKQSVPTQTSVLPKLASQTQPAEAKTERKPKEEALASAPAKAQSMAAPEAAPTLVFSAAMEPSQSWLGRNKYVLGALLAVAGTVAVILMLR